MSSSTPASPLSWGPWFELNDQTHWPGDLGIYRIRLANASGTPFSLGRVCAADPDGIVYIGRSGCLDGKKKRTLGQRLQEFVYEGSHSGGWTFWQAKHIFQALGCFADHRLFASVVTLSGLRAEIVSAEASAVRAYFNAFGELPPFNSAFPGKWKTWEET